MDLGKTSDPSFDPHLPRHRWKLWVILRRADGARRLHVFWRRVVLALLACSVAGWCALAGAAYVFLRKKHDFPGIAYVNLVFPHRWSEHRAALGRHLIATGRRQIAEGLYVDAARSLGAGLTRAPDDLTARRELAVLLMRFGNLPAGLDVLRRGVEAGRLDLDYLRLTFSLMFELRQDREADALARSLLPARPDENLPVQFTALQLATARFHLGDYDGAEAIITDWRLDRSIEGLLLAARCDWERGQAQTAVNRLEQAREKFAERDEIPLQLIRFYRDLGRNDQAHNEALIRYTNDPLSPGPRIDLLYSWHRRGDQPRIEAEITRYLQDFSRDRAALMLLAWYAADTGTVAVAERVRAQFAAQGLPTTGADLAIAQALISEARYREALVSIEAALKEADPRSPFFVLLSGLRAVASFGSGDPTNGDLHLQVFLTKQNLRATDAIVLAERLERVGASTQSRAVLAAAVRIDSLNQSALTGLIRHDLTHGDLAAVEQNLPALLRLRKPSRSLLQECYLRLDDTTAARAALRESVRTTIERLTATPLPQGG